MNSARGFVVVAGEQRTAASSVIVIDEFPL
jgi:hypothetical protein